MEKEINLDHFREKLLAEKVILVKDLSSIGRINPDNPKDWEATPGDINEHSADKNKQADNVEDYESRTATLKELEGSLKDVIDALEKIEEVKYGICEISGKQIELDRLEANPSSRTCKEHLNS